MSDGELPQTTASAIEELRNAVLDFVAVLIFEWRGHGWMLFVTAFMIFGLEGEKAGGYFLAGMFSGVFVTASAWMSEIASREKRKRDGKEKR